MRPELIREILRQVEDGSLAVEEAMQRLKTMPLEELGFAVLDHHRQLRTGCPEVVLGTGKTVEQVLTIAGKIAGRGQDMIVTRVTPEMAARLSENFPAGEMYTEARIFAVRSGQEPVDSGLVAVISAGTGDQPVAEEAAVTAELLGVRVERVFDVGVAGLHRLLNRRQVLAEAAALVVVAGMEGALPSVVGGLVDKPVIAVPTSVGYGAHFSGVAPLLTMINTCAAGVSVVNIDNGFGAGYQAALIARAAGSGGSGKDK